MQAEGDIVELIFVCYDIVQGKTLWKLNRIMYKQDLKGNTTVSLASMSERHTLFVKDRA